MGEGDSTGEGGKVGGHLDRRTQLYSRRRSEGAVGGERASRRRRATRWKNDSRRDSAVSSEITNI